MQGLREIGWVGRSGAGRTFPAVRILRRRCCADVCRPEDVQNLTYDGDCHYHLKVPLSEPVVQRSNARRPRSTLTGRDTLQTRAERRPSTSGSP